MPRSRSRSPRRRDRDDKSRRDRDWDDRDRRRRSRSPDRRRRSPSPRKRSPSPRTRDSRKARSKSPKREEKDKKKKKKKREKRGRSSSSEREAVKKEEQEKKTRTAEQEEKEKVAEAERALEQSQIELEQQRRREAAKAWQELKRRREEEAAAEAGKPLAPNGGTDAAKTEDFENGGMGKKKGWSLEDEDDDSDVEMGDALQEEKDEEERVKTSAAAEEKREADQKEVDDEEKRRNEKLEQQLRRELQKKKEALEADEVDPLDAFMMGVQTEVLKLETGLVRKPRALIDQEEDLSSDGEDMEEEKEFDLHEYLNKQKNVKVLKPVDHDAIEYAPFRKRFYIEVPEIAKMSKEEVKAYLGQLDGIKIRGKNCPKPIKSWSQCGLSDRILAVIKKNGWENPTPIQCQMLPIIMSGRDCIGVAKTGSGKTAAYVLPMCRHLHDQPRVVSGEGPISIVFAPARELCIQIFTQTKMFAKVMGFTIAAIYGGAPVAEQINELRRGVDVIVCTPGRMIDMLCANSGRVLNLQRVTYLCVDEADRMFDMGFEPQISRIIDNCRPDKQLVMLSATFPQQMESLAKRVLQDPLEIVIGGRSVVSNTIDHYVEVRDEASKFFRLLELLGGWYEKGSILIFVDTQDDADSLLSNLLRHGYPCLSLHGGKDQSDRDSTLIDFKNKVATILVATSVAARGLDVKHLRLVINYDCPTHYEDYVHRVGRTGRAGREGTAYTFITENQPQHARDLVKALELSGRQVPPALKSLSESFKEKKNAGLIKGSGSGFGGKGFKFNEKESKKDTLKKEKREKRKELGLEEESEEEIDFDDDEPPRPLPALPAPPGTAILPGAGMPPTIPGAALSGLGGLLGNTPGLAASVMLANGTVIKPPILPAPTNIPGLSAGIRPHLAMAAAAAAAAIGLTTGGAAAQSSAGAYFTEEIEINDYPQHARWKVTHRDALNPICEFTNCAVTTKGVFVPEGKQPPAGERKLYLIIEGSNQDMVRRTRIDLKKLLEEATKEQLSKEQGKLFGRYTI